MSALLTQLEQQRRTLATAIMFLTRIPVGQSGSGDPRVLAASTQYFPLVGVIVGSIVGLVFYIASFFWSTNIAVILSMISAALVTGAFHEDGLADVADSAGAWTKEKKLDIMRDSRIGTYGGLALILASVLCAITLIDISSKHKGLSVIFATFVLAHVLGRWSSLALIYTTNYARDDAANKVFVAGVNKQRMLVGSLTTLLVIVACYLPLTQSAFIASFITLAGIVVMRHWFIKQFGGITGDCLGAGNKCVEICVYLSIVASLPS